MIIASLGMAFWAFIIAYELLPKFWQSGIVAILTFITCMLAISYEIRVLLGIIIIALPLLTIFIAIGRSR